jgi:hypothetical protein
MRELDGQQLRQLIDTDQLYAAYRAAYRERRVRFAGSMVWKTIKGRDYLYKKKASQDWKSLGGHSDETVRTYERFIEGRARAAERLTELDNQIRRMAPINRAMGLGRVPATSAKLLRRLERLDLLGEGLRVAGTHALFAYERLGGVQFGSGEVATADIDLLYDARRSLGLVAPELDVNGLIGVLRKLDPSFEPIAPGSFRAANAKGFMVDLITPAARNPATASTPRVSTADDDLVPVEIEGLTWLQNSPGLTQTVISESGYPVTMQVPDPRAFALHKAWLAQRADREPQKRRRDLAQARAVAAMLLRYAPHMSFDDASLQAFPARVRDMRDDLIRDAQMHLGAHDEWDS